MIGANHLQIGTNILYLILFVFFFLLIIHVHRPVPFSVIFSGYSISARGNSPEHPYNSLQYINAQDT